MVRSEDSVESIEQAAENSQFHNAQKYDPNEILASRTPDHIAIMNSESDLDEEYEHQQGGYSAHITRKREGNVTSMSIKISGEFESSYKKPEPVAPIPEPVQAAPVPTLFSATPLILPYVLPDLSHLKLPTARNIQLLDMQNVPAPTNNTQVYDVSSDSDSIAPANPAAVDRNQDVVIDLDGDEAPQPDQGREEQNEIYIPPANNEEQREEEPENVIAEDVPAQNINPEEVEQEAEAGDPQEDQAQAGDPQEEQEPQAEEGNRAEAEQERQEEAGQEEEVKSQASVPSVRSPIRSRSRSRSRSPRRREETTQAPTETLAIAPATGLANGVLDVQVFQSYMQVPPTNNTLTPPPLLAPVATYSQHIDTSVNWQLAIDQPDPSNSATPLLTAPGKKASKKITVTKRKTYGMKEPKKNPKGDDVLSSDTDNPEGVGGASNKLTEKKNIAGEKPKQLKINRTKEPRENAKSGVLIDIGKKRLKKRDKQMDDKQQDTDDPVIFLATIGINCDFQDWAKVREVTKDESMRLRSFLMALSTDQVHIFRNQASRDAQVKKRYMIKGAVDLIITSVTFQSSQEINNPFRRAGSTANCLSCKVVSKQGKYETTFEQASQIFTIYKVSIRISKNTNLLRGMFITLTETYTHKKETEEVQKTTYEPQGMVFVVKHGNGHVVVYNLCDAPDPNTICAVQFSNNIQHQIDDTMAYLECDTLSQCIYNSEVFYWDNDKAYEWKDHDSPPTKTKSGKWSNKKNYTEIEFTPFGRLLHFGFSNNFGTKYNTQDSQRKARLSSRPVSKKAEYQSLLDYINDKLGQVVEFDEVPYFPHEEYCSEYSAILLLSLARKPIQELEVLRSFKSLKKGQRLVRIFEDIFNLTIASDITKKWQSTPQWSFSNIIKGTGSSVSIPEESVLYMEATLRGGVHSMIAVVKTEGLKIYGINETPVIIPYEDCSKKKLANKQVRLLFAYNSNQFEVSKIYRVEPIPSPEDILVKKQKIDDQAADSYLA